MRASAGAPVPEFGHDKTPLVGGGCYRYRLWCLNAPGLSAWEQCSTVISKNVLSGADFFGRPTPTLPSRVLTFTKVACTVLTGPRHLQCSQHLQAAHCPASASFGAVVTDDRTLASIALFSGNRPGNQHGDAPLRKSWGGGCYAHRIHGYLYGYQPRARVRTSLAESASERRRYQPRARVRTGP